MDTPSLQLRMAALDFVRAHIHILDKTDKDRLFFDCWWSLNWHLYKSCLGEEVLEMARRIIALAID